MRRVLALSIVLLTLSLSALTGAEPQAAPRKIRVGTYDTRGIAIAYAASKLNPVRAKTAEYEKAKAEGDTARAHELEQWGEKLQRQLHRQGFGRVPVGDLLEPVKDQLAGVAAKAGVDLIASGCDYATANVETVDVTLDLVALYAPSEQTLRYVKDLARQPVVDLDEIDVQRGH
jgi:hypothetical protein